MSKELSGTGLVADDLYLMAHSDQTGKPLLKPRPLGIGLAGGLLAELMLADIVSLRYDRVAVTSAVDPMNQPARWVLDELAAEPEPHPVREWLLFLARDAANAVALRLEQAGYLTRVGGRFPWSSQRWVPVDPDWAFSPMLRARSALESTQPVSPHAAALAGLADACGLGFRVAQHVDPVRSVSHVVGQFGPGLHELITQVQETVDSALLSHRT